VEETEGMAQEKIWRERDRGEQTERKGQGGRDITREAEGKETEGNRQGRRERRQKFEVAER
jgi:hypothetical protein